MASYDVALWLRSERSWPEIVLVVQAETASDAASLVLHARHVSHAAKVAVNMGGVIYRWYGVTTLLDGFDYRDEGVVTYGLP